MLRAPNLPKVYLKPGELSVAEAPTVVSTVLGSCVAITLHCPTLSFGAICHAMLPSGEGVTDFKFVDRSLAHMLKSFDALGVRRSDIVVKLFGGADMLETGGSAKSVGRQNIDIAHFLLKKEGLNPAAEDIGGMQGRKLFFYPHTGEVFMKRLAKRQVSMNPVISGCKLPTGYRVRGNR